MRVLGAACVAAALCGCQSAIIAGKAYYEEEKDYDKARQYLELGIQQSPGNPEAHFWLGRVHAAQGDFEAMAAAFARSLELSSEYDVTITRLRVRYFNEEYNRGIGLVRHHPPDYPGGLVAFRNAAVIDPESRDARRNLAYVYYSLDSLAAAAGAYGHLLESNPADEDALLNIGSVYIAMGRHSDALEAFRKLREQDPFHDGGTRKLAALCEQLGELEEAGELYRQLTLIDAADSSSLLGLGRVRRALGEPFQAIEALESALAIDPADREAFYQLAMAYAELGNSEEAIPRLEVLTVRMPERVEVWAELSRQYAARGWSERSRRAADRGRALSEADD